MNQTKPFVLSEIPEKYRFIFEAATRMTAHIPDESKTFDLETLYITTLNPSSVDIKCDLSAIVPYIAELIMALGD